MASSRACSAAHCSRSFALAASSASTISARSGSATSSRIRGSNPAGPSGADLKSEIPQQTHECRSPRPELSPAAACGRSAARGASGLFMLFTCTGRNRLTRIICAIPRASLRSLLLTWALRKALALPGLDADGRQIGLNQPAVEPLRKRPRLKSDPDDLPCRLTEDPDQILGVARHLCLPADLARSSSTMQTEVSFTDTSNPA